MPGLLPNVDPDGYLEYSVVFTDRALNHMSQSFQGVMNDISATLKKVYNAQAVLVVPGSGTFAMEGGAPTAHSLHYHNNVTTTSVNSGEILKYNGGGQWVNNTLAEAGIEPAFSKNTGFNLNLGNSAGQVSEGDHTHPAGDILLRYFPGVMVDIIPQPLDHMEPHISGIIGADDVITGKSQDPAKRISQNGTP